MVAGVIAGIKVIEKYGPLVVSLFKGEPRKVPERINSHPCSFHQTLETETQKNSVIITGLVERADRHHREQREDIHALKDTLNTNLRDICFRIDDNAKKIAEHDIRFEYIGREHRSAI